MNKTIKIEFLEPFSDILVIRKLEIKEKIKIENSKIKNLKDLIDYISAKQKNGKDFKKRLLENNKIADGIIILKNGQNITFLDELETKLENNDTLVFMRTISGG